jgi:hypothetical protein
VLMIRRMPEVEVNDRDAPHAICADAQDRI